MNICTMIITFMIYSFLGWIVEIIDYYILYKKIINRGFLIGPYCPIYGVGCTLITLLLTRYSQEPLTLFIVAVAICSILEYTTSYLMEVIFKTRWWDYSNMRFNINGRVCLETLIPFGIGGMCIIYLINPLLSTLFSQTNDTLIIVISIILASLFIIDLVFSLKILSSIKKLSFGVVGDSTEKITKYVKDTIVNQNKKLQNRIIKSFPKIKFWGNKKNK